MTNPPNKPKEPFLALLLSVLIGGLGQIYAGYTVRGVVFIVLPYVMAAGLMWMLISPDMPTNLWISVGALVGLWGLVIWILVDAYRCAKRYNAEHGLRREISGGKRAVWIMAIIVVLCAPNLGQLIAQRIRADYVQAFRMPAGSMRSTLREGDRILTDKRRPLLSRLTRGDVIVFDYPKNPERQFVKRLIAFGGETVEIIEGDVYVNGELVTDPRIKNIYYYNNPPFGSSGESVSVPSGFLYVLGDNSASSHDSRMWGFVPEENVIGIAYKIYWPPERSGPLR